MSFVPSSFARNWTHAVLALRPADAMPFEPDVRIRAGGVFAQHRDGFGRTLGWEAIVPDQSGRTTVRYTRGQPRGLVMAAARPGVASLFVAEGAIAALSALALGAVAADSRIIGLGGVWNAATAGHVATLAERNRISRVQLAMSEHHEAGRHMRDAAGAQLRALGLEITMVRPPTMGWAAALRGARLDAVAA